MNADFDDKDYDDEYPSNFRIALGVINLVGLIFILVLIVFALC